jgi:hypothetical protein
MADEDYLFPSGNTLAERRCTRTARGVVDLDANLAWELKEVGHWEIIHDLRWLVLNQVDEYKGLKMPACRKPFKEETFRCEW